VKLEEGCTLPTGLLNANAFVRNKYPESITLAKGTWILMHIYALHNWEGNWGSDVNEFKPERFLSLSNSSPTQLSSPAAYMGGGFDQKQLIFAPFSYGVRNCLGMNMAMWEIRSTFSRLIMNYEFRLADETLLDENKTLTTDITMKPLNQLPVFLSHRH
jgi:cytochrome P450